MLLNVVNLCLCPPDAIELNKEIALCKFSLQNVIVIAPTPLPFVAATRKWSSPWTILLLLPDGANCDSGPLVADALKQTHLMSEGCYFFDTMLLIWTEHASSSKRKICCDDCSFWQTPFGLLLTETYSPPCQKNAC